MGITTKDLAQMCGVSRTTVHRALSGVGRINPDTKEMILRIAKENDYRPDLLARGLAMGKTSSIGIVVLDVKNRYFSEMLDAIGAEASKQGYCMNIMLHDNIGSLEKEQMTRLAAYHMDGIILSSVNEGEEYREFLEGLNVPIVSVDNRIAEGIPFVGINQECAMEEATLQVLEKGYDHLVYVCPLMEDVGEENINVHRERMQGFKNACEKFPQVETDYLLSWNYLKQAEKMLLPLKKTAFLCAADSFALDLMKQLQIVGENTPDDYGIVGFDNMDMLQYVSPRLCSVSNSVDLVAKTAIELLFQIIEEKRNTGEISEESKHIQKILPHQLIAGETL